jgi:hypothetical protein
MPFPETVTGAVNLAAKTEAGCAIGATHSAAAVRMDTHFLIK